MHTRPRYRNKNEPFFVFSDKSPVKPEQMRAVLKLIIQFSGFHPNLYSTHSLRTGRALDLLKLGLSVETIKKMGRWKSNSVFTYLK